MKILIVTPRYYPEQFSINYISQTLAKNGNDVTVLTGKPHYGYGKIVEGYENLNFEIINGIKIYRVKERARKKSVFSLFLNYLSIYFKYNRFLKKHNQKYDVVLSHVISPIFILKGVKNYCFRTKTPHVHYGLDLWPESLTATYYFKRESLAFNLMKKYSRKLYSSCDIISFGSPSAENYFSDYLSLPHIPFYHIYQPVLATPPEYGEVLKYEFRPHGKLRILYCGTIAKFHRVDIFIEALSRFPDKKQIEFQIVGSGSELETIKNLVQKYNLNDVVTFYGRVGVKETISYYLEADVLFIPLIKNSRTSYLIPQKVSESLMFAKPILGMLVGDGADIISKASQHNILSDQTPTALLEALLAIEKLPKEILKQCGKENRDFFDLETRFHLSVVCKELEQIMLKAIELKKVT